MCSLTSEREMSSFLLKLSSNVWRERDQFLLDSPTSMLSKVCVLSAMIVLTVTGNLCCVAAIVAWRARRKKLSRMYYFLLHLSVADLLTAFLTLAPELPAKTYLTPTNLGLAACKGVKFLQMVAPYLSSYILVAMATDRFQSICYPMTNRTWKPESSHRKILLAWLTSLLFCVPQILVFGGKEDGQGGLLCIAHLGPSEGWRARTYVCWFILSSFVLPLCGLVFCYANICAEIRRNLSSKQEEYNVLDGKGAPKDRKCRLYRKCKLDGKVFSLASFRKSCSTSDECKKVPLDSEQNGSNQVQTPERSFRPRTHSVEGISRAKVRSVKQTVVIILGYVLCSSLAVGFQLWSVRVNYDTNISYSIEWFFWLATWNSIVNPWVYILLNRDLQISLRDLLLCADFKKPTAKSYPNRRLEKLNSLSSSAVRPPPPPLRATTSRVPQCQTVVELRTSLLEKGNMVPVSKV